MNTPDPALDERNVRAGCMPRGYDIDAYSYGDATGRIVLVREDQGRAVHIRGFREGPSGWHAPPIPFAIVIAHAATSHVDVVAEVLFEIEA